MKVTIFFVLLASTLVFANNEVKKQAKQITVEIVEHNNMASMHLDVIESIEEAFDLGSSCQGRMQLLVPYLKSKATTKGKNWVVAEQPCGIEHNSVTYGYYKVTQSGVSRQVYVIAV
nr:uncharacterized protein LOC111427062 [Onthophagus taurus]